MGSRRTGRFLGLAGLAAIARVALAQPTPAPGRDPGRATPPASVADVLEEVRALRAEVSALRERPEPATAADVERIRSDVERLATAERDLAHEVQERSSTPPPDPPADPPSSLWLVLIIGLVLGWGGGRLAQRRRDRRQRGKLRW